MELKGIEKETLTGDNKSRLEFKSRLMCNSAPGIRDGYRGLLSYGT